MVINPYEAGGVLAAVLVLLPLTRAWTLHWMRRRAGEMAAAAPPRTVKRWTLTDRLGRFDYAYLHGAAVGAGVAGLVFLLTKFQPRIPVAVAAVVGGFYGADWGAQAWSAREARIRLFERENAGDGPAAARSAGPGSGSAPDLALSSRNLLRGSMALTVVLILVVVLAAREDRDGAAAGAAGPKPPVTTPAPSPAVAFADQRTAPPLVLRPPDTVIGAASPPPATAPPPPPGPAESRGGSDAGNIGGSEGNLTVVLEEMNREADALMPNTLPAPVPAEEYKGLETQMQGLATKYFPDLRVRGSVFNREFVARYTQYRSAPSNYFDQPDWPVRLAQECAQALAKGMSAAGGTPP